MHEYVQWAIYNTIMFSSLYVVAKMIEYQTWKVIENYDEYEDFFKKWIL